jgi:carbon-monoxide dehydrogenase catalytic subunit
MPEDNGANGADRAVSCDSAVCEVLSSCEGVVETAFDRASSMRACNIGAESGCCKHCAMGPCRLVGKHTRGI